MTIQKIKENINDNLGNKVRIVFNTGRNKIEEFDGVIKESIKDKIKQVAKELNLTTIIVTHDPEEALSLSDRVMIMNGGHILQYAKSEEIINQPKDSFVTEFILKQLEIKRNNILTLFESAGNVGGN